MTHLHRRLFLLCGDAGWCRETARRLLADQGYRKVLWFGDEPVAADDDQPVPATKIASRLGSEWEALVFDAWSGFDTDAFGAAVGTVRGGGVVLLLTPPLGDWPQRPDPAMARFTPWPRTLPEDSSPFLRRLTRILSTSSHIETIEPGRHASIPPPPAPPPKGERLTEDQLQAVAAIRHTALGHRRRPLVLTADRGRGKSSALGVAAARLLREGKRRILVTAPTLSATAFLFRHAREQLPDAEHTAGWLRWRGGWIRFRPPDTLCRRPEPADLLLVDEAAAIPVPLLTTLLRRYARIVFSTTIHGYEGTGRGFTIRFRNTLEQSTPHWRTLHLSRPTRWAENDPVERFGFRALLLDATPADDRLVSAATPEECESVEMSRERLLADETLLRELFGLLVQAHYRTRPSDLRQLLDGPEITIHALLYRGHVTATAVVVKEGGLDEGLANRVWLGERRVRGHLLPQSLAAHAGFPEAARLRYARIMRLAVHPALRRRGLGSRLVTAITEQSTDRKMDAVGAGFGATPELLAFWRKNRFSSVHVGLRREASSGDHALFLFHPLTPRAQRLQHQLRHRLTRCLPALLNGRLSGLEPEMVAQLLQGLPFAPFPFGEQAWREIASFAFGRRGDELCAPAIRELVLSALGDGGRFARLPQPDQQLLIGRIVLGWEWAEVARRLGFSGRKAALSALRHAVAHLLSELPHPPLPAGIPSTRR